jgi:hypothetical protein
MKVSGQLKAPSALPQWKETRYQMDRRLSGPQSRFERGGKDKNSLLSAGNRTPVVQPVA